MKPGRNDPCPCGSGKKYKRCCLEAEGTARGVGDVSTTSTRTPTGTEAVRSGREIVEQMNREAPNRGLRLTAYQVARIAEPDDHPDPETRKLLAAHKARNWTFAKLATMETGAIEDQLRAFGVNYTRERYLEQSVGKQLAWTISEEWLRQDPVICKGKDEDFLGLAACELWKRLIPERLGTEIYRPRYSRLRGIESSSQHRPSRRVWMCRRVPSSPNWLLGLPWSRGWEGVIATERIQELACSGSTFTPSNETASISPTRCRILIVRGRF